MKKSKPLPSQNPPQNRSSKTPKDYYLWNRVARTVSPLKKGSASPQKEEFAAMFRSGEALSPPRKMGKGPISQRQDKKTRRGQIVIDGKIDLHDMTQAEAFDALQRTLIRSYNQNKKCLLVVTGKGVRGRGVLRQSLPKWLEHPDMRPMIAEFAQAHIRHGGSGAWYVFLRG